MATTLNASALLDAQAKINAMFSGGPTQQQFDEPAFSANALFMNNDARISLIQENGKYIKQRIYHLNKGSATLDYDGVPDSVSLDCTLSEGAGPTSVETIYDNNILKQKIVEFDTNVVTDLHEKNDLLATVIAGAMVDLRASLNEEAGTFLDASKTAVSNDASLADGITFNTNTFEIDPTKIDMKSPDGLTEIDFVAQNEKIGRYWMLTGRYNFASALVNADFHRLNDNERYLVKFGDYDMYVDPRGLDSNLTGKNTFVVGRGTYAAWNTIAPSVPDVTNPYKFVASGIESSEYYIEDPVLRIWDNGTIRPVRYHVFEQWVCNDVSKKSLRRHGVHRFEISFNGGLQVAPPASDGHTGILKFKTVDAV